MNGTAHAAIGAATGFTVAHTLESSPTATLFLIGLGSISALVPDLDIGGKLRGKITLSHKILRTAAQFIGMIMIFYSFYAGTDKGRYMGIGIGIGICLLSSTLKQKHMLSLTGLGVIVGGLFLEESWLMLLGGYILIASFVSHRGYTHSIIGVIFFGLIAFKFEASLGIAGVFYTCLAGYISHLIADSKLFPLNKRGVKLFLPISTKEV